jgi:hypothetical protein
MHGSNNNNNKQQNHKKTKEQGLVGCGVVWCCVVLGVLDKKNERPNPHKTQLKQINKIQIAQRQRKS